MQLVAACHFLFEQMCSCKVHTVSNYVAFKFPFKYVALLQLCYLKFVVCIGS